jgi:ubiquinone/menaquinone biosynthesis C-methylase UbiE
LSESSDPYTAALKIDDRESERYYAASLGVKTEQQKQLENLLRAHGVQPVWIADIACGGGAASHHLGAMYPRADYTLVDLNDEAVRLARQATQHLQATCLVGNIYDLPLESDGFDLVICWQTLSWLGEPERALRELIRICKPDGRIYASSLFNANHDVDVYSTVQDHTRASAAQGLTYTYNTYAVSSVRRWVDGLVSELEVHEFSIPVDLHHAGKGLGTYTVTLQNGSRLQISAGMLLNWGILEIRK